MNKRNVPYIISYILEILLVLLGAVFYRQPLLSVLLLLLLILPPISIIITKHEIPKLSLKASLTNREALLDGMFNVKINTKHTGLIPLLNCTLDFTFENLFYPHKEPQEFTFPAEARQEGEFTLPFNVTKAGMIVFEATRIRITDYLHLYTFTEDVSIRLEIPVLPKDVEAPSYSKKKITASSNDGDPSEIYTTGGEKSLDLKQLREYRSGDRLKDIHWKLTAKTNELMVREYEEIKELYYLLFPILTNDDNLQKTLEIFLAIGKDLIREREPFSVAIYNSDDNTFTMEIVTEEDELYSTLYELYKCPLKGYENAYQSYSNQFTSNMDGVILIQNGKVKDNKSV